MLTATFGGRPRPVLLATVIAVLGLAGCPAPAGQTPGGTGARAPGASPRRAAAQPAGLTHEKGVPNGGDPRKGRLSCVPLGLQLRAALPSAASAEDLVSRLEKARHCAGFIVTAADPRSGVLVLELSAEGAARRRPQGGLVLSTNHFRTPALRSSPAASADSSHRRLKHLNQALVGARVTPPKLMASLHARPVFQSSGVQTIQTVIVYVTTKKLWLWRRGTPPRRFTAVDLSSRL